MQKLQRISQALGLVLSNSYVGFVASGQIYQGPLKGFCLPFLSCYACPVATFSCPIGSLQHFMAIRTAPLFLLGMIGLFGILVGRMACGWLCPFGLLQDLLFKIPTRKLSIPYGASYLKYAVLVSLVIIIPFVTGAPWFSKLCPFGTLSAGLPWVLIDAGSTAAGGAAIDVTELGPLFGVKLAILGVFLLLFVVSSRPFCRTTCPLAAILSLLNPFSIVRLKVTPSCRDCGACRLTCPVQLQVSKQANSRECIRCLRCTACKHVVVELTPVGVQATVATKEVTTHG